MDTADKPGRRGSSEYVKGRQRPVRVCFTEEEHADIRKAAALLDMSCSRFVVTRAVEAARRVVETEGRSG